MIKSFLKRLSPKFQMFTGAQELSKGNAIAQVVEYERLKALVAVQDPENIAIKGYKVYSQTDEDGIIDAIFSRIGHSGTFVEIGVQSGVECNSLLLLLKGWRGVWLEGDENYCQQIATDLGKASFPGRFRISHSFIDRDNIVRLLEGAMSFLAAKELDFFSLDIDGNDLHVLEALIDAGIKPKVICAEYNGKFPPPVDVSIRYDATHVWDETDYMGSSLQAFVNAMEPRGYRLITCNIVGINAFFVRDDIAVEFAEIPVERLYQPYRFYLSPFVTLRPGSLSYLREMLASLDDGRAAENP